MSSLNTTSRKLTGAAVGAVALTGALLVQAPSTQAATVSLPPTHAAFDYQIGGAYTPPTGVRIVTRDHTASPAAGLYNICYVNAFQAQPGAESDWDSNLLLRDSAGKVVYDKDWGEALLDVGTAAKRQRIANTIGAQIDGCRDKGFQAVEPDNYDSYTRSGNRLTASNAQAYIKLLSTRSHTDGLAIAQKNTSELAGNRAANGLDFAVAEECGQYDECGDYTSAFGNNVIVIEYTDAGRTKACKGWGGTLSIVQRDVGVSPAGSSGYVRKTC
jgi:hypothetical protein